jgi:hypothetical protein
MPDNNLFFALSNSAAGKDAEFNEWYDTHHIKEVPETHLGFMSGRRFRLSDRQRTGEGAGVPSPWTYLAIYQLDPTVDVAAIHADGRDHPPDRTVSAGDTLSPDHVAWTWEPIGPRRVREGPNAIAGGQQHVLLVLTNPAPGREDDFNAWYDEHHLPQALERVAGRVAAQRYRLTSAQRENQWLAAVPGRSQEDEQQPEQWLPWRYLALYELEGDDVAALQGADAGVRAAGELTPSDHAVDETFAAWLFSALPDPDWRPPAPRTATGALVGSR